MPTLYSPLKAENIILKRIRLITCSEFNDESPSEQRTKTLYSFGQTVLQEGTPGKMFPLFKKNHIPKWILFLLHILYI